jgi:hypothetical protein
MTDQYVRKLEFKSFGSVGSGSSCDLTSTWPRAPDTHVCIQKARFRLLDGWVVIARVLEKMGSLGRGGEGEGKGEGGVNGVTAASGWIVKDA